MLRAWDSGDYRMSVVLSGRCCSFQSYPYRIGYAENGTAGLVDDENKNIAGMLREKGYSFPFGTCNTALGLQYGHWHRHTKRH